MTWTCYAEARRSGREQQFYLFHLGHPEVSARYNAIGNFSRITEVATRIANQLPSEGISAAFKEFAWRFVNIIARALVALGRRPDYQQVRRYINDIEPLFIEYARSFLAREGLADWQTAIVAIGKAKDRPLSATAFIAAVGNGWEFKNARTVAAWLGLVPRQHSAPAVNRGYWVSANAATPICVFTHPWRSLSDFAH